MSSELGRPPYAAHSSKRASTLLASVLLCWGSASACSETASIGVEECIGANIRCTNPVLQQIELAVDEVSTRELPMLPATFSWTIEGAGVAPILLTRGSPGSLWLFKALNEHIEAYTLDADGEVTGQARITPPEGAFVASVEGFPQAMGPMVLARYRQACPAQTEESTTTDCLSGEYLLFSADVEAEPLRLPWRPETGSRGILRTAHDDYWHLTLYALERRDSSGKILVRQSARALDGVATFVSVGNVLRSGDLAVIESVGSSPSALFLRRLSREGNVEYYGQVSDLSVARSWGDVETTLDSEGRWIVAASDDNGDLLLARFNEARNQLEGSKLMREDYTSLRVHSLTVDASGSSYVATVVGGRDDARVALCRLPPRGEAQCFLTAEKEIRGIVGGQLNVLYSYANDGTVTRYDLPP